MCRRQTQNLLVCRSEKSLKSTALGYTHKTVNHRRHFVDPQGIHTNIIDNTVCRDNLRENLEECKDVDELFLLHTLTNFCGGEIEPKREYCPIYCKQLQDNIHSKSTFFVLQFLFGINFFDK